MAPPSLICVGSYASADRPGLYLLRLDPDSGALAITGVAKGIENPSFVAIHPDGRSLYAVEEVGAGPDDVAGRVQAFAVDARADILTPLGGQPSLGASPCHLVVDRSGTRVLVANYHSGSVAVLPIRADGGLGAASAVVRHRGLDLDGGHAPHAHAVVLDQAGRFAFVADLGLDRIFIYRFDAAAGTLVAHAQPWVDLPHGSGPRQLAWSPSGTRLYAINEFTSTIAAFAFDPVAGRLQAFQTVSTRSRGSTGESWAAQLVISADGRFIYGSNRGDDSLAVLGIDAGTGGLIPLGHRASVGRYPRHFAIDRSGRWLLVGHQRSDTLVVIAIDPASGTLGEVVASVSIPQPACICVADPAG